MTIAEFLLARIAEDEQNAQVVAKEYGRWERERALGGPDGSQGSILVTAFAGSPAEPARMLRECEAKRRILDRHHQEPAPDDDGVCNACIMSDYEDGDWPCAHVRILAAIYADHLDYDEAWAVLDSTRGI